MNWSSSNHPISDLRDWNKAKKLEIRPDFQRRQVWSKTAKIMLIDTIIRNIPMPKLYLETRIDDESTFRVVIDGQQRITAIIEYLEGVFTMPKDYEMEAWAGKKFVDLEQDEKNRFLNYELNMNNLANPSEQEVRDLYSRVNKYTVQLNRQELRKCDYPGDFIELAESLVEAEFFDSARVFSPAMTRRMNDVEYIEELLMIVLEGMQDKKKSIDEFCEKYQVIENKEDIKTEFLACIVDINKIFETMDISKMRFKQRTDLYTLFAVIDSIKKQKRELKEDLSKVRERLVYLDENIMPLSEEEKLREYAIRCTSDANSLSSRKYRYDFMYEYIEGAYEE